MQASTGSTSGVWKYFKKKENDTAQCSRCPKILSCKGSSTSGLARHLEKVHNISVTLTSAHQARQQEPQEPSTSTSSISDEVPPKKKRTEALAQSSIDKIFKRPAKLPKIVATLAAKDGLSIRAITNSAFIRESLQERGLRLPKCETDVMKLIVDYAEELKQEIKTELKELIKTNSRFSISLDEWTSVRNRRYFNVNLHGNEGKIYNLGLAYIPGRCGAAEVLQILNKVLSEFDVELQKDIVGITTDGPNVMKKFGRESPAEMILCMNHAIHLAVMDVMYRQKDDNESETDASSDSESDYDLEDDFCVTDELENASNVSIRRDLSNVLKETRKIVKYFRRSPLKNIKLQEHVKIEFKTEMSLCLDVKTRWNSIETMLERFIKLKNCIRKALIDLNAGHYWHEENMPVLNNLVEILGPIKLAVAALSSRNCDILKCEAIISVLLKKIANFKNDLAVEFLNTLKSRIAERRNATLYTLLKYLQNPTIIENEFLENSATSRAAIIRYAENLFIRLFPDHPETDSEESPENELSLSELREASQSKSFAEELREAILNAHKNVQKSSRQQIRLNKDFQLYETSRKRTPNLELLYNALLTIVPTSTESERVFSIAGNFATKIRSRLSDKSLNALTFLKGCFRQIDK